MPARFLAVTPPIKELWWEGNRGLLADTNKYLAIVGSRRMTDYGRRVLEMIMPDLVQAGIIVVSGMMYGVDQEAHKMCQTCRCGSEGGKQGFLSKFFIFSFQNRMKPFCGETIKKPA